MMRIGVVALAGALLGWVSWFRGSCLCMLTDTED